MAEVTRDRSTPEDVLALADALSAALSAGLGTDLRLAQIIGNAVGGDPYGFENAKLVELIRDHVAEWPGITRKRPMLRKLSDPPEPPHVDDFIDDAFTEYPTEPHICYAKWFLCCARFSAVNKMQFRTFFPEALFCTYEGKRYRVTGCSRLGDVWLTSNFEQAIGYELRVMVDQCSQWSPGEVFQPAEEPTRA